MLDFSSNYRVIIGAAMLGVGVAVWSQWPDAAPGAAIAAVVVPELQGEAQAGEVLFAANCAACHGVNGVGVDGAGPPLLHKIYEPSHHGDAAFYLAVLNGVRAHHWSFGNMLPVKGVSEAEVAAIVAYVRALQRANGIF
jgi:mono/diheme cytochrome c family protein